MSSLKQFHHTIDSLYIHEFKFEAITKATVDDFLNELNNIMRRDGNLGGILLDMSTHQPPIQYFTEQLYAWLRRYFLVNATRIAIITPRDLSMLSTMRLLLQAATAGRNVETAFFSDDERENAMKWLSTSIQ